MQVQIKTKYTRLLLLKQNVILLFVLSLLSSFTIDKKNDELYLIPQPESVKLDNGFFDLGPDTKLFLPKEFLKDLGSYIETKMESDAGLILNASKWNKSIVSNFIRFEKSDDASIEEDGYILEVSPHKILVKANSYGGMFYAFQTLRQLIPVDVKPDATQTIAIQSLLIKDKPRFEWRGVMLDPARHFLSKEFILKQIDIFSAYKMNRFHWHLSDDQGWRIEIKKYPNLVKKGAWRADRTGIAWWKRKLTEPGEATPIGGYYTQDDIKEVIEYARVRNVEIVPEIDIPGHSMALIASYPFLSCLDDYHFEVSNGGPAPHNALCAGKETTYEFLKNVFIEVADLFPFKYIHIGGDECKKGDWKECPHCNKKIADHNLKDEHELQSYFVTRISKQLKSLDRELIGWDEILSGKGTPGSTIMAWRRNRYKPEVEGPQAGHKTIQASYTHAYLSQKQGPPELEPEGPRRVTPVSKVYSHEPMPDELTPNEQKLVMGTQVCLWGEFVPTHEHCEYMLYPRTLANAEVAWSDPALKDWKRFQTALELNFKRFDKQGVNYSTSMYNIYASWAWDRLYDKAMVHLLTETVGYTIYYTLNGDEPSVNANKYTGVFPTKTHATLKAGLFDKNGKLLGKVTEMKLKL